MKLKFVFDIQSRTDDLVPLRSPYMYLGLFGSFNVSNEFRVQYTTIKEATERTGICMVFSFKT